MDGGRAVIVEEFEAYGHPKVRATHRGTIEITRESLLTSRGDCIVGLNAEKACGDLSERLKRALRRSGSRVQIVLNCEGEEDRVSARGDESLTLGSTLSMVIRKSDYVCHRTLAVGADKAARDLSRALIEKLREGKKLRVKISVF
ncbi:MAG: DUF371 domain-containing protein [Candidatus Geothermarchaeales archaeon]